MISTDLQYLYNIGIVGAGLHFLYLISDEPILLVEARKEITQIKPTSIKLDSIERLRIRFEIHNRQLPIRPVHIQAIVSPKGRLINDSLFEKGVGFFKVMLKAGDLVVGKNEMEFRIFDGEREWRLRATLFYQPPPRLQSRSQYA